VSSLSTRTALALATLCALGACTSMPRPGANLSDYSRLGEVTGRLSKRAEAPIETNIEPTTPLWIQTVDFTPSLESSSAVSESSRDVLSDRLARQMCVALSTAFELQDHAVEGGYRLRVFITDLKPTGRMAAAASVPLNFFSPIGARIPLGLGSLALEVELLDAEGRQVAAMVWWRDADMSVTGATVSQISDAYVLAGDAANDFAQLVRPRAAGQRAGEMARSFLPLFGEASGDPACRIYDRGPDGARGILARMAPGLPPESYERDEVSRPERPQ